MQQFIVFILSNFTLSFLVLGFFTAELHYLYRSQRKSLRLSALFLSHFLFFSYGCSFFYNFMMHVFFGKMAAHFIGWQQSPFQLEVGFASLGFAVMGFIAAFTENIGFRLASMIGVSFFLWGAAGGHIYQMLLHNNFAPGNAGIIFWTDISLPILSFALLYFKSRK